MARKRTRAPKVKEPAWGYFPCLVCEAQYWYPREFAHRDWQYPGHRMIPNPGVCDACLDKKKRRAHKKHAGCIVDWDGALDGLMSLEDDEPQTARGQMLLF
jgi:hypothetical protein